MGRKTSLIVAASLATTATLAYAGFPSLNGAIAAIILEALAYSFLSGASEALMHDTLTHLDRVDDYPKIAGRAQSIGLVGSTILVGLVPLTYHFDPRLPFVIGAVCYLALLVLVILMKEPPRIAAVEKNTLVKDLLVSLRFFINRHTLPLFCTVGLLFSIGSTADFLNLSLRDMGLAAHHMGAAYVGGNILGIAGGLYVYKLRTRSLRMFMMLDLVTSASLFAVIGITRNLYLAICFFWLNMGFFRIRNIMYQYHLLNIFKESRYKATLISVISFFGRANEIWVPFVTMGLVGALGYYVGFTIFAVALVVIIVPSAIFATHLINARYSLSK
jgi:MFS family permease